MSKRTTVTLDDRVFNAIKSRAVKEEKTFQEMLNNILRKGLVSPGGKKEKKIKICPVSMGKSRVDITDRNALYDVMDKS